MNGLQAQAAATTENRNQQQRAVDDGPHPLLEDTKEVHEWDEEIERGGGRIVTSMYVKNQCVY